MALQCYLFPIPEIEKMILSNLNPLTDYGKLILVNKHYHKTIIMSEFYLELYDFHKMSEIFKIEFNYHSIANSRQKIFYQACYFGYFKIIQLYLKYFPKEIDINTHAKRILLISRRNGHFDIVEYVNSLKILDS